MQDAGLVSSSRNPVAEFLASVAIPAAAMRAGPAMFAAEQRMAQNAMAPRMLDPQTGAIVWHGSPHKFDKFDSGKIGTGEGAQMYGHGLYLAETPDVAKAYMLANQGRAAAVDGALDSLPGALQVDVMKAMNRKGFLKESMIENLYLDFSKIL
jgi:hypothetical protein